jgi:hypothetical protein
MATGEASGLVVIDGDGMEGRASLADLERQGLMLPSTLTVSTGRPDGGEHRYCRVPSGVNTRNDQSGKIGPHIDVRGTGGYVVIPPSIHSSGKQYHFIDSDAPIADMPDWVVQRLTARQPVEATAQGAPQGCKGYNPAKRQPILFSLAGKMRALGVPLASIEITLLALNSTFQNQHDAATVRKAAAGIERYAEGTAAGSVWITEGMDTFLMAADSEVEWVVPDVLAPGRLTQIFAPRGIGKSLLANHWAVESALRGLRVLILDRDNSRLTLRTRLHSFGAAGLEKLQVVSRGKCPPLTQPEAWSEFPYADFDLVIVDSLDAMAEGIGEQDSSKPARAMAPLLNICHREDGPAVLLLGNTIKSAAHSRGSGVVEDRADIVLSCVMELTLSPLVVSLGSKNFRCKGLLNGRPETQGAKAAKRIGWRWLRQSFAMAKNPHLECSRSAPRTCRGPSRMSRLLLMQLAKLRGCAWQT